MGFTVRWGLLSAGKICHDFASALGILPRDEHVAIAVAARDAARAEAFAQRHDIPHAFGSYEELVRFADIDIIYVGSKSTEHKSCVLLALNAGKAVLCEKCMGSTLAEVTEMVAAARHRRLFLMEGFWSRFFPAYQQLKVVP